MPVFPIRYNSIDNLLLGSLIRRARVTDRRMSLRLFLFLYFVKDGER